MRRTPLERRAPLRADPDRVRAWQARSRRALPRTGRAAARSRAALDSARDVVRERLVCEAARLTDPTNAARWVCDTPGPHRGAHAHHVWPEDRDGGVHDPERMLWLCADAHRWVHEHPAAAAELGLLRPR